MVNPQFNAISNAFQRNHWQSLLGLLKYLSQQDSTDLRRRVVFAIICLALSKGINVYVPFFYKDTVDALSLDNLLAQLAFGYDFSIWMCANFGAVFC